jgi:hypothetical protein
MGSEIVKYGWMVNAGRWSCSRPNSSFNFSAVKDSLDGGTMQLKDEQLLALVGTKGGTCPSVTACA